jgi:hypothetical protein
VPLARPDAPALVGVQWPVLVTLLVFREHFRIGQQGENMTSAGVDHDSDDR